MNDQIQTPSQIIHQLPEDKMIMEKLRKTILDALPKEFLETIRYGLIAYVFPHSLYPNGYHCDPKQPLPFSSIASQKSHIYLYHMMLCGNKE